MKKIISMVLALGLVSLIMLGVCANTNSEMDTIVSIEDERLAGFTDEMLEYAQSKLASGGKIYYGEGTTTPSYLNAQTRGIPTEESYLQENAHAFNFTMTQGNVYYSPWIFCATSNADMKIFRTSATGPSCNINLQIIDITGQPTTVFNQNLPLSQNGATSYVDMVYGHKYYMKVTPLTAGETYAAFLVSQG